MAWTTPRTWVTLEKVTASIMNTHVRDNLDFLFDNSWRKESSTSVTGGSTYDSGTLPAGFRNYRLVARGFRNAPGFSDLNVEFNSDSTAAYRRYIVENTGSTPTMAVNHNDSGTVYRPGDWGQRLNSLVLDVINGDQTLVAVESQLGGDDGPTAAEKMQASGQGTFTNGPVTSIQVTIADGFTGAVFDLYGSQ